MTAKVIGPESELKEMIQQRLALPFRINAKGKLRRAGDKDKFQAKPTARQRKERKDPADYNASDMWFVFVDAWKEVWSGSPVMWTGKDRGQIKRLIADQGPEAVLKYIEYVVKNWDSICQRYRLNGYPSVSVLYGYRRSLVPECLNGVRTKEPSWGAEYTEG